MPKKANTKEKILDAGAAIIYEKGYNNTGIQEILKSAGVPKGSFYFYFSSKDEFGEELVNHIAQRFRNIAEKTLLNDDYDPIRKLETFFDHFIDIMDSNNYRGGCPLGNLAQEIGDIHEGMRTSIEGSLDRLEAILADIIDQMDRELIVSDIKEGSVLAPFILNSWQGTILRMKVTKSKAPIALFRKMVLGNIFKD